MLDETLQRLAVLEPADDTLVLSIYLEHQEAFMQLGGVGALLRIVGPVTPPTSSA
jgi:hypothetical protein